MYGVNGQLMSVPKYSLSNFAIVSPPGLRATLTITPSRATETETRMIKRRTMKAKNGLWVDVGGGF